MSLRKQQPELKRAKQAATAAPRRPAAAAARNGGGDDDEDNWATEDVDGGNGDLHAASDADDDDDEVEFVPPPTLAAIEADQSDSDEPAVAAASSKKRKAAPNDVPPPQQQQQKHSASSDPQQQQQLEAKKAKKADKFKQMKEKRREKLLEESASSAREAIATDNNKVAAAPAVSAKAAAKAAKASSALAPAAATATASSQNASSSSSSASPASSSSASVGALASGAALDDHAIAAMAELIRYAPLEQQAGAFTRLMPSLPKRSALEREGAVLHAAHFIGLSPAHDRTALQLPAHVKHFCPDWARVLGGHGVAPAAAHSAKFTAGLVASPVLLVVTHNVLRAVDFIRAAHAFKRDDVPIGKLFARHMKFDEQVANLQGEAKRVRVAVGTVNRVLKLLDAGALSLERTRYLVVDCEQTVKKLLMFNMPDSRVDFQRLFLDHAEPRLLAGKMALALY